MLDLILLLILLYLGISLFLIRKEARWYHQDRSEHYELGRSKGYHWMKKPSYLRSLVVGFWFALLWPFYLISWVTERTGLVLEWSAKKFIGGENEKEEA